MGTDLNKYGYPEPPENESEAYRVGWRTFYIGKGVCGINPYCYNEDRDGYDQGYADAREEEYEARKAMK